MPHSRCWAPVLLTLVATPAPAAAARPITLHPDNPHYFLWRDKPTVLITSAEHYGAVINLDFDGKTYLDVLRRDGLNHTRIFSGAMIEDWGEPWNTLNPPRERFLAPWARSGTPGFIDGGNKFDLDRWDARYFARLRDYVAEAGRHGVVVEVVLFNVYYQEKNWVQSPLHARNNVNGIGARSWKEFFDPTNGPLMTAQERLVRKIAGELHSFDNVYFELCNEPYSQDEPRLHSPWNDRIVRAIREVTKDHLIAVNVSNKTAKVDQLSSEIGVVNFHYAAPPVAVAENQHLRRAIAFDETGFRGNDDTPYRIEAWDFMVAGGAVYSNLDWSFTIDSALGTSTAAEDRLGPSSPALRRQLGVLKRFVESLPFVRMRPANEIIKGGAPAGGSLRALAEPGKRYVVYAHHSPPGKKGEPQFKTGDFQVTPVLDLPAGKYSATWIDPASGRALKTDSVSHAGGTRPLPSPRYTQDIALEILRK